MSCAHDVFSLTPAPLDPPLVPNLRCRGEARFPATAAGRGPPFLRVGWGGEGWTEGRSRTHNTSPHHSLVRSATATRGRTARAGAFTTPPPPGQCGVDVSQSPGKAKTRTQMQRGMQQHGEDARMRMSHVAPPSTLSVDVSAGFFPPPLERIITHANRPLHITQREEAQAALAYVPVPHFHTYTHTQA